VIDMDEYRQMIEDCENRSERLTEWELRFVDSLSMRERPPTEKQVETLNAIWDRVTAKG